MALALVLGLCCAPAAPAGEFTLTADEAQRVAARQVVVRASLDASPAPRNGACRGAH